MHRLSLMFLVSAGLVLALCDTTAAEQVRRAERLVGADENPPVITDASGNFRAQILANRIEFRLRYDVAADETPESDVTQAHLHVANPGNNGGITVFLCSNLGNTPQGATVRECPPSPGIVEGAIVADDVVPDNPDPELAVITAGDLDGLARLIRQGAVYANVHSVDHEAGEVRGQVSPRIR